MKKVVKELTLRAGLYLATGLGFVIQHWRKIAALGISATILALVWDNMRLRDELTFTQGCLKVVQENLVRTDLELDEKERDLNNLKNYLSSHEKGMRELANDNKLLLSQSRGAQGVLSSSH